MQLVFLSEYFDYHKFLEAPQKLKLFLKWPDTSTGHILGNTVLESICKVNIVNYCSFIRMALMQCALQFGIKCLIVERKVNVF